MRSFYTHGLNKPCLLVCALLHIFFITNTLFATTFVVTNTNDNGAGSLRQAILSANADNTATPLSPHFIDATGITGTITMTAANRFMVITNHITIKGSGQLSLTISGNNVTRIFWIQNGSVSIQDLTLTNGLAQGGLGGGMGAGGAIFMHEGRAGGNGTGSIELCLLNVTFTGNKAQGGTGTNSTAGGGMGGNGSGGGGGVLGAGSVAGAGGSITSASGGTPGGNGGIAIFGTGGIPGGTNGTAGGFGAGGGSGENGGNGGFGGGGGLGSATGADGVGGMGGFGGGGGFGGVWGAGGNGGFGGGAGGGGTTGGNGGFGGGNSNAEAGGGGMGAGGAIFVASGKLIAVNVKFVNNTATRGLGAGIGTNGKGLGGAIFLFKKSDNGGVVAPGTTNDPLLTTCGPIVYTGNMADDDLNTASNNDNIYGTTNDATPTVNSVPNQTWTAGSTSTAVTFGGNNNLASYPWENDNTATGLGGGGLNTVPSFVTQNNTNAPIISTVTVTPEVQLGCTVCSGASKSFTITVNPGQAPTVNPVPNQVVCNNTTTTAITFTGSLPNTVFNWVNNTPSIGLAASGSGNIAAFTALNAGAAPAVASITVTPSRTINNVTVFGSPITFTITVNPTPNVATVPNQVLCNGSATTAINFTGAVTGTAYSWTNSVTTIGLAAAGNGNIASFTATNTGAAVVAGTVTVTPRYTNAGLTCTGPTTNFTITVNPTPTVATVANQVICDGAQSAPINFTGIVTGTVFNWTNTTPAIGLPTSGSGNIAAFTAVNNGTAPVTATITVTPVFTNLNTSCTGTPTTFTLTVNPTPSVNPVNNQVLCHNSATTSVPFSGDVPGTVYNWTNNTTSVGLAASGTGTIPAFSAKNTGTAPITATITVTPQYSNGGKTCNGTPITFTYIVNPTPTVAAVTNKVVCAGDNIAAINFTGTVTGTTFSWTNNNASIGLAPSGTGNIAAFSGVNAGNTPETAIITVTPQFTNAGVTCSGTPTTFNITVNPEPTVNAVPNQTLCNGELSQPIVFTGAVTGTTFSWTNNTTSIGLGAMGTGNIAAFTATNNGTASVTASLVVTPRYTNASVTCTGDNGAFSIVVHPTPTVNPIPNQTVCTGNLTTAINFTGKVPGTTYIWTNNTTSIGLAAAGTGNIPAFSAVNTGTAPVTALIVVTPRFMGCDGAPMAIAITVDPLPTQLVCNEFSTFVLDEDCKSNVLPGDILMNAQGCVSNFTVTVTGLNGAPNFGNMVTAANLGQTLKVTIKNTITNAMCSGNIKVVDSNAPKVTCPPNVSVACSDPVDIAKTGNITVTDCSNTTPNFKDVFNDLGDCNVPRATITRTWTVTDAFGNQSTCSQTITIRAFDLATVVFPPDVTLNCSAIAGNTNATLPAQTGTPSINGGAVTASVLCNAKVNYTDEIFGGCTGTYTIVRTWSVLNDCLPANASNPAIKAQRIKVVDNDGPTFTCPPSVTVSTNQSSCCANAVLPSVVMTEGCSKITSVQAMVNGVNPANGNLIQFVVPGALADFPGNNYKLPDTLATFGPTQCLPLGGTYTVMYVASDACANSATCTFTIKVEDFVAPVATCDQTTTVALGDDDLNDCYTPANGCKGGGVTWVNAKEFDDGSKDKCHFVKFTVRRMPPYSACIENLPACEKPLATAESDSIKFYCCEAGTKQRIILRVYQVDAAGQIMNKSDGSPLFNECMIEVEVQDKLTPICQPPANVTVACENFDPTLWAYGQPAVLDNCCLDTTKTYQGKCGFSHVANYALFDTLCHRGTIVRNFQAFDCHGFTSECTQRVVVTYNQDYFVKFPDDVSLSACDGTGNYGTPTFFGKNCEALSADYEDFKFTLVQDGCFKIERKWRVINWCTYNPNIPLRTVPNPNPETNSSSPLNLPGPVVSKCGTIGAWAPTIVKINPTDATTTDFCTFWEKGGNGYSYTQIIKVLDQQKPTINCAAAPKEFCDGTKNANDLWNETYWLDKKTGLNDLCEGPTDLSITATDACSGAEIDFQYLLFLDLDDDGSMETVINSANLPPANTVNFGNANNPNFSGGTARAFDERSVSAAQKYAFALQVGAPSGKNRSAFVRWNTTQSPNQFVVPELPHGTHKIKWIVSDGCGNQEVCEHTFVVKDCQKPGVICYNGLSANIVSPAGVTVWANDFLKFAEDNCTPGAKLKYGIRKVGSGTGFPTLANGTPQISVAYTCKELGTQFVELWAMDLAGNMDFCKAEFVVQDNMNNCNPPSVIAGSVETELLNGVEEVTVKLTGNAGGFPVDKFDLTDANGKYEIMAPVASPLQLTLAPMKDINPLNGVSTYDLVLISKHILGLEPLSSPYKMIAADANKSNSITTLDIVELRKLILGIYSDLPNCESWRFVDKSYVFPNLANPFSSIFPETKLVTDVSQYGPNGPKFVAMKTGDVNQSASTNFNDPVEDRFKGTLWIDVEDRAVQKGEVFELRFVPASSAQGVQMTLIFNGLDLLDVPQQAALTDEHFAVFDRAFTLSVDGAENVAHGFYLKIKALKAGKISEMLHLSNQITVAEAYAMTGERQQLALRYSSGASARVGFELYQNQPNPFNGKTAIGFHLPESGEAQLRVFRDNGQTVLTQKGSFAKGHNTIVLERSQLPQGVLFYELSTEKDHTARKMIVTE